MKTSTFIGTCAATLALHISGIALAGGEGWTADFTAAKKQAAAENKDLLVDFTGSDWCGWCIKLNEEVFSHEAFKKGVKDSFVLAEIDFPKDKSILSKETQKQNEELGEKYAVKGYPTILLTDAEGRPYAATGYQAGGPDSYVKHLNELRERKKDRDAALAKAVKSEGVEKAKALQEALAAMSLDDEMVANFYSEIPAQIKAADPTDETGYGKAAATKEKLAKFQEELSSLAQSQDFDGALALVDKTIADGEFTKDDTQQLIMTKAMILAEQGKFDAAIEQVEKAKAVNPAGEMAEGIENFKKQLEGAKAKKDQPADEKAEDTDAGT